MHDKVGIATLLKRKVRKNMPINAKTPIYVEMTTNISQEGQKDQINLEAAGELYRKNDFIYVTFTETLKDIGEVNTLLKVGDEQITVIRKGAVSMRQPFFLGEVTSGSYETPFGKLATEANTDQVSIHWSDDGNKGDISFGYDLTLQGSAAGRYDVKISIEEET